MRRRCSVCALVLVMLGVGAGSGAAGSPGATAAVARRLSATPVASDEAWRSYVLDDDDGLVYPVGVTVQGDVAAVEDPEGLGGVGGGVTTIRSSGSAQSPTPTLVLDLGLNTGGFVEVAVAGSDGTPFRLGYSEAREFLRPVGDITPRPPPFTTSFGTDDDPDHRNDVFDPAAGSMLQRFVSPAVRGGQRWIWLQVEGTGTVSIDYVRVQVTNNRPNYVGWFHSSDDALNRVWYAGAYTTNLTTIRDARDPAARYVYVDGAKRDRLVWAFDMLGESLNGFYAFDTGPAVARNSIHVFSCQQEPSGYIPAASQIAIRCPEDPGPPNGRDPDDPAPDVILPGDGFTWPAFTALWVVNLGQYHFYTGDTQFARSMLPVARHAMRFFSDRTVDGLFLSGTHRVEGTWHVVDPSGAHDTFTNAVYHHALVVLARLEREIGDGEQAAARYEADAGRLAVAMKAKLWDDAAGAFLVNDTDPLRNHTSDANVWGPISGAIGDHDSGRALSFIQAKLATPLGTLTGEHANDPFMSRFHSTLLAAWEAYVRFLRGDDDAAVDVLRRGFAWIASADPGTLWERAGPNGERWFAGPGTNNFGSLAHGYSPVAGALSMGVLGIRPLSAGYATWIVQPQPADLTSAEGQAPTPHGPIQSRWERTPSSFRLTVAAPGSTQGVVAVPLLGARRAIARDGTLIWDGSEAVGDVSAWSDGRFVYIDGVHGSHTFAWASN